MKVKSLFINLAIFALLIGFSVFQLNCEQETTPISGNSNLNELPAELAFIGYSDPESTLDDATFEKDFTIETPGDPKLGFDGFGRFHGPKDKRPGFLGPKPKKHKPPFRLFDEMNLSEEQKALLKSAAENHFNCMKVPFEQFREVNSDILEETNTARKGIMEQLKNGTITQEEAKNLLQELNDNTRLLIEANPANEPILAAICSCNDQHYQEVASILNAQQLSQWDVWHAQRPNPCTE